MTKYHSILDTLRDVVAEVAFRVKRNPVLVGAAAYVAFEGLSTGDPITWHTLVATGIGFLVRSQTVPAHEVHAISDIISAVLGEATEAADEAAK